MQSKAGLRREVLRRRAERTETERAAAGEALAVALEPVLSGAARVAAYASVGSEPPTEPLIARCRRLGIVVLLPVLCPDGDLDWAAEGALEPGPKGLLEPAGPRLGLDALATCDLVLVPALAVDRSGTRLGRGGGSYDRALPRAQALTIAVLYDGEAVDVLPSDPHDVRVQAVVTPGGFRRLVR